MKENVLTGRVLAIDYGQKRVGLAVTDTGQIIASSLATVRSMDVITYLKDYVKREPVVLFLVGEPKQMNYEASESAKFVEPFVRLLTKEFPTIPVKRVDERFTSMMAQRTMLEAGLKKKDRQNKALVDTISATIMLQSYLEQQSSSR